MVRVIGSGAHAKVVLDLAWFYFGRATLMDGACDGKCIVGIGDNAARAALQQQCVALGAHMVTAHHQTTYIGRACVVGDGSVLCAGAILVCDVLVGKGCIINTHASVDHDCTLGDWVHVAPGATLCGGVTVGNGALIGAGATVVQGVTIGEWATVGAGAVVLHDVEPHTTVVGVPARVLKHAVQ